MYNKAISLFSWDEEHQKRAHSRKKPAHMITTKQNQNAQTVSERKGRSLIVHCVEWTACRWDTPGTPKGAKRGGKHGGRARNKRQKATRQQKPAKGLLGGTREG